MDKINIVIPMAGKGQRFKNAGYTKNKPFIDILGTPMIQKIICNVMPRNHEINKILFICQQEDVGELNNVIEYILNLTNFPRFTCQVIPINYITEGPASTVMLANDHINNEHPLLIANSDQYIDDFNVDLYIDRCNRYDGGILCFWNNDPKWSYVRIDNGFVIETAEKKPISEHATVGIYYFKRGSDFVAGYNKMRNNNDRTNNEFYVAPVYNYLIENNMRIIPHFINDMHGLGTPDDLQKYIAQFK